MTVNLNNSHQASKFPLMGRSVFSPEALDFIKTKAEFLRAIFSQGTIPNLLLARKSYLSYQNETTP